MPREAAKPHRFADPRLAMLPMLNRLSWPRRKLAVRRLVALPKLRMVVMEGRLIDSQIQLIRSEVEPIPRRRSLRIRRRISTSRRMAKTTRTKKKMVPARKAWMDSPPRRRPESRPTRVGRAAKVARVTLRVLFNPVVLQNGLVQSDGVEVNLPQQPSEDLLPVEGSEVGRQRSRLR